MDRETEQTDLGYVVKRKISSKRVFVKWDPNIENQDPGEDEGDDRGGDGGR